MMTQPLCADMEGSGAARARQSSKARGEALPGIDLEGDMEQ